MRVLGLWTLRAVAFGASLWIVAAPAGGAVPYGLVDGDSQFDTKLPPGGGPSATLTIAQTGGCSCEQIIEALGLGGGHVKFGCSQGEMEWWLALIHH